MTRRPLLALVIVLFAFAGASLVAASQSDEVLSAGTYTAKVKALTCGGCGPLVKRTLEGIKEIESATVDSKALSVQFVVKKDSTVKLTEVQKALKAAADKMGMGADYTLSGVKVKS